MTYRKWVHATAWPLMAFTLLFLVAWAWLVIGTPHWIVSDILLAVLGICWASFILDYVMRLVLVRNKRQWVRTHWLDLLTILIPLFRPVQLLKLLSMLGILPKNVESAVRVRIVTYAATSVALMLFVGSLAVL